jgi:hypothetical protein
MYVLLAALFIAAPVTVMAQEGESAPREAVPRSSRPQGDNPRTGTAVRRSAPPPRTESAPAPAPAPRVDNGGGVNRDPARGGISDRRAQARPRTTVVVPRNRRTVIVQPNVYYNRYPRSIYPYGYGAFGLGYFYYDPYRWGASAYPGYGYGYGYGGGHYQQPYSSFDIGELRLDVEPRHAQVFVDGYYAGVVDDFDGAFQSLKLEPGAYRIDISAPGFETLTFDVRLNPGQDIRYRGILRRF